MATPDCGEEPAFTRQDSAMARTTSQPCYHIAEDRVNATLQFLRKESRQNVPPAPACLHSLSGP